MGHYYSEMHVATPQEEWNEALDKSLRDMGYGKVEIEFKTFYICGWCGCLVGLLDQHLWKCSAGDKSAEIDRMVDHAMELILNRDEPIELMKLAQLASENSITIYALKCAIDALVTRKKITRQHSFTKPYQDTIISLNQEEAECLPES